MNSPTSQMEIQERLIIRIDGYASDSTERRIRLQGKEE